MFKALTLAFIPANFLRRNKGKVFPLTICFQKETQIAKNICSIITVHLNQWVDSLRIHLYREINGA